MLQNITNVTKRGSVMKNKIISSSSPNMTASLFLGACGGNKKKKTEASSSKTSLVKQTSSSSKKKSDH